MLRTIKSDTLGRGMHGWLDSHFHFSFAEYYNPERVNFGVLRVLNDDIVQPGTGFGTHPHEDMEIISYVLEGELGHADSMGNRRTLTRGEVQYMSAGTGITHSEYNQGTKPLRFFQMWIVPDERGHTPNYGEQRFAWENRVNKWMTIAVGTKMESAETPVRIHQDAHVFATYLNKGKSLLLEVKTGRQAYLVVAEGKAQIQDIDLYQRDAMEIVEEDIIIKATEDVHIVVIEMAKE